MLRLEYLYWLVGAFLIATALLNLRERHYSIAAFWMILAGPFVLGDLILAATTHGEKWPAQAMGVGVIALGLLAARGRQRVTADALGEHERRVASATRLGNRLFTPALAIPLLTVALYLGGKFLSSRGINLLDPKNLTLTALGLASILALGAALRSTRARPMQSILEGRRLLDSLSWAVLLPMILATLGGVFAATGVGDTIAALTAAVIPIDSRIACLLAFALGMVFFTIIMGNAFAAFPVMMAGIGLPLLILRHGADPAVLGAIGMLTGYCGTLLTPMAANFNIVPAVLLELPDQYGVIRSQVPTALALMVVNILLMIVLVFR
ncbi:MAG: DUF979 domain-containing protein [Dokdonella sp.]|uniref:DUF979 domain-containing protein n=1 Tax=Dokdonella sp. TaxID=2291710 RepID=UPI002B98367D|nr:DUF979 domain-containing protein [Dokdonella sp.]HOX71233.1 DUF979 domain-containing protein [Dokdonella sp.]HPG94267.1 DUF979 domain-containing protein [Dokdonella sp.]HPN79041.1 DUF979 domain-containing protein [Dokdonella sp.]